MQGIQEFIKSRHQDRRYDRMAARHKVGWSKWHLTKRGDDTQGWCRFLKADNTNMSDEMMQTVFPRNNTFRLAESSNDIEVRFFPFLFETAVSAMRICDRFTKGDLFGYEEFIDIRAATAYMTCLNMVDHDAPDKDFLLEQLDEIFDRVITGTSEDGDDWIIRREFSDLVGHEL